MAAEQLSGTIVVIIIAIGVQGFIMLFIFAKRQITRFSLRNRRGPHTSIGHGAPKALRREIDRCLEYVQYIRHEPRVDYTDSLGSSQRRKVPEHSFRSHAIALYNDFEGEIANYSLNYSRLPGTSVRGFLLTCLNGPLHGVETLSVHELCDQYDHARHHFEEFGSEDFKIFSERIQTLRNVLRQNKSVKPHPSPLPAVKIKFNKNKGGNNARSSNTPVAFSKQPRHELEVRVASKSGSNSTPSDV